MLYAVSHLLPIFCRCLLFFVLGVSLIFFSSAEATATGFVRVKGDLVVDEADRPVMLRGLNVEFRDFRTILGEEDILRMAAAGANMIRLVIDSRDLESLPFQYSKDGFELLDSVINWCEQHGLFVILDMHRVPGNQNTHDFVVHREKRARFWQNRDYQRRFSALWREIARRYKDRWIIAGYDLLNEGSCPSEELYKFVISRAAREIRREDPRHIIIVEEVILPGWRKKLVVIDDSNVLYSVHFFHPPEFAFYMTTRQRALITYPGSVTGAGSRVGETGTGPLPRTSPWTRIQVAADPPEGADILVVRISSRGNSGRVWFDGIALERDGIPVDLPAPHVSNGSFEIDYPGFNWPKEGVCAEIDRTVAKKGERSLRFRNCKKGGSVWSSPIAVQNGRYILTAWYKAESATGMTALSLSWHTGEMIRTVTREDLEREISYALDFKERHGVPLYVGEFTAHLNPSSESVSNYLRDVLEIMERERLHWSFWEYYSVYRGVGIYGGKPPTLVNPTAWDMLNPFTRRK